MGCLVTYRLSPGDRSTYLLRACWCTNTNTFTRALRTPGYVTVSGRFCCFVVFKPPRPLWRASGSLLSRRPRSVSAPWCWPHPAPRMHSVGSMPPRGHHDVPLLHSTVPLIPSDAPHCCARAQEPRRDSGEPPLDPAAVGLVHSGTSCF